MSSTSALTISKKFQALKLKFVTPTLLASLLNQANNNTNYKTLQRLEKHNVLIRLNKGKYLVAGADVPEFSLANWLIQPSYISLESALAYYGILPQFSYSVTSVTARRAQKIFTQNREFNYVKTAPRLFWGYTNHHGSLIASAEKACLDYLYLAAKGLKNPDIDDWDLSLIKKGRLKDYAAKFAFLPLKKLLTAKKLL
mgnify:CR=1 FL=1